MNTNKVLILNEKEIKKLITSEQVLNLVETVLADYARGSTINPIKLHMPYYPYYEGYINCMPSFIKDGDISGAKIVTVHKNNPAKYKLPTTIGTIILIRPQTGIPYAILDGTYITDIRTGAVVGVAAKYLAKKNSEILTIVGAGVQGMTSMEMVLLSKRGIKEVRILDISKENQEDFINKAKKMFPHINYIAYDNRQQAYYGSDIVVMATTANYSLLEGQEIDDGTTVICVDELLNRKVIKMFDQWIVDFTDCVIDRLNYDTRRFAEINKTIFESFNKDMVNGEIGDVIIGKKVGRVNNKDKILFDSIGMSIEDLTVANTAYNIAMQKNVGKTLSLLDI